MIEGDPNDPNLCKRLLTALKGKRGIVFDFDGVLVDSVHIKGDAFVALYADEPEAFQRHVRQFHLQHGGMPRTEKLAQLEQERTGSTVDAARLEALVDRFATLVTQRVIDAPEMPGASDLLAWFAARMPVFVCSATPEAELESIVRARGWGDRFEAVFGSPASKRENLATIVERLGCSPEEVLMFGDAVEDWESARAVGTGFIAVAASDGLSGRAALQIASPKALVTCLRHAQIKPELLRDHWQ